MKRALSQPVLNAFVDGELSAREAARVAELIAADPVVAKRVATLHQMKAALSTMSEDLDLPAVAPPRRGRVAGLRAAMVACLCLLTLLWPAQISGPEQKVARPSLVTQHDHWLTHGPERAGAVLPAHFDWLGPVLSASGLWLVHHAQLGDLEHFGFKGVNDCRLSLFVSAARSASGALSLSLTAQVQQAQWQIGASAFTMIARDMAPARFAAIATGLHRESLDRLDEQALQIALAQAARLPCTA